NSREGSRANVLNNTVANGGLGLNGEGVTIGIGDNSAALAQIDFAGRLIERNTGNAFHGVHVMGTSAGAGNVNELYRGYASKATIINASDQAILTPLYVQDHHMVLTNNSYGPTGPCEFNGIYTITSQVMD